MNGDMSFAPTVGVPFPLAPDLSLVLAPNPSPMTFLGTNTYLLGTRELAVIDPGPDSPAHLDAVMKAVADRTVTHILLTHSHLDHSPLAGPLSRETGARIYAFGDSRAGRSPIMQDLAAAGLAGGGEGIDQKFAPDVVVNDGDVICGAGWQVEALHTPGHIGNHLCYRFADAMFTGDHVMGWSSSLVSPPDGDLTDFMRSCHKLRAYDAKVYYPGHGAPVTDPAARLTWLIEHRMTREAQILAALTAQAHTVTSLTRAVYSDLAATLLPAAERNVFAHLVDLVQRRRISADPALSLGAEFRVPGAKSDGMTGNKKNCG